jgi:hypothetical protein
MLMARPKRIGRQEVPWEGATKSECLRYGALAPANNSQIRLRTIYGRTTASGCIGCPVSMRIARVKASL